MTSMTYGDLPTREAFDAAWEAEGLDSYRVRLNSRDSDALDWACPEFAVAGPWEADELWEILTGLTACWESGDPYAGDAAGDLASSILTTLGFEWV